MICVICLRVMGMDETKRNLLVNQSTKSYSTYKQYNNMNLVELRDNKRIVFDLGRQAARKAPPGH